MLVTMPATCGSAAIGAKVAPPLKSTSISASCSGGCPITSDVTRVRSISDLPEPVAPTISPCGPIPPCADSFRSSITALPEPPTPIGTRSNSRGARDLQVTPGSRPATSGTPRISGSPTVPLSPPEVSALTSRSGAHCRARPASRPSGGSSTSNSCPDHSCRPRPCSSTWILACTSSGSSRRWPSSSTRWMPSSARETPRSGGSRPCTPLRFSPSTMITRWSRSSARRPRRRWCSSNRASSSAAISSAIPGTDVAISRAGRSPSRALGCVACGSHFSHSQPGAWAGARTTPRRTSSGEWNATSWAASARPSRRPAGRSPTTLSTPTSRRSTQTGWSRRPL